VSPLRKALYGALRGDGVLTAKLSSPDAIYHRLAPEGAKPPYIVFRQISGARQWAFQEGQIRWPMWLVEAVDRGSSSSAAEDIDARIDEVLTDAALSLEGFDLLYLRREMDMPEPLNADAGEILHKVGGIYRIAMEPA
jgi:uncharacterized protein DUF3168